MKKILTCLMAAVVLIMSLPITALAATNFNPQISTGYYPDTIPRSIPKAYTCHLGGTSEEITAEITYGTDNKAIGFDIWITYTDALDPGTAVIHDAPSGNLDVEVTYRLTQAAINAGSHIDSALASYFIMTHSVAVLEVP